MPDADQGHVPQTRAVSLTGYQELAGSMGLDADAFLRFGGIDPAMLADPEARLPAAAVAQLLERSASATGCDTFGLRLASLRTFTSIGPLALLLRHAPTLRDVFLHIGGFARLLSDVIEIRLEDDDDRTNIHVSVPTPHRSRQSVELTLALTYRTANGAVLGGWRPLAVCFMHPAPADDACHAAIFNCPLRFDAPFDGFISLSAALDKPNAFADEDLAGHARAYLETLQQQLPKQSFEEQVGSVLRSLIPAGEASLDAAARRLSLHPRALQRRLTQAGTSFQQVLEQTREQLAVTYLAGSETQVTEIGHQLGFQTPTSFTRWFTARMGKSPSAWRQSGA